MDDLRSKNYSPSRERACRAIEELLRHLGEDPDRPGLIDTPERVVRAWEEHTRGYAVDVEALLARTFDQEGHSYDQLILSRDIPWHSHCEHHLALIEGVAHVAYVPREGGRIVGLSKLARLVDAYALRLQVQERLTEQIAAAIERHLEPRGTAVILVGRHTCQACRGVRKDGSMVTSSLHGFFREDRDGIRTELMGLINLRSGY